MPVKYESLAAFKRAHKDAGGFFFSPDTMRFFSSRIESDLYRGRVFITSEKWGHENARHYAVRIIRDVMHVDTHSRVKTLEHARETARELAKALGKEAKL